jgi:hypothetical protein
MVVKLVSIKSKHGNYSAQEMLFNNEQHFDAWLAKSMSKGLKVVGHIDLALEINCDIKLSDDQFIRIAKLESLQESVFRITEDRVKIGRSERGDWIQYNVTEHESNWIMLRNNKLTKWSSSKKQIPIYKSKEIKSSIHKLKLIL